jgi:hypothetical protein
MNNCSVIPMRQLFKLYFDEMLMSALYQTNKLILIFTEKLYHIMLYTLPWSRFELTTSVAIGTDCIGICKSNYHTIMTTTSQTNKRLVYLQHIKWLFCVLDKLILNLIFFLINRIDWEKKYSKNSEIEFEPHLVKLSMYRYNFFYNSPVN